MADYTAESIRVLSGLEAVRRRPGMYVGDIAGGEALHHVLWNAVEASLGGRATWMRLTIDGDQVTVEDDSRLLAGGSPEEVERALELTLTTLHVGPAPDAALAVVNALSKELEVLLRQGGRRLRRRFARGESSSPLEVLGPASGTGLTLRFVPDRELLGSAPFDHEAIAERLFELSCFRRGVTLHLGERTFSSPEGLGALARHEAGTARRLHEAPICAAGRSGEVEVELALLWTADGRGEERGFVNERRSPSGDHVEGLWDGIAGALARVAPLGRLDGVHRPALREVVGAGLCAAVQASLTAPRFRSCLWDGIESAETRELVSTLTSEALLAAFAAEPALVEALLGRLPGA